MYNQLKSILKKIIPVVVSCLTLVITISANSSGCGLLNQPIEPPGITKYKKFK